jgi:hypothetical protein
VHRARLQYPDTKTGWVAKCILKQGLKPHFDVLLILNEKFRNMREQFGK